jgi:hypothetical protein
MCAYVHVRVAGGICSPPRDFFRARCGIAAGVSTSMIAPSKKFPCFSEESGVLFMVQADRWLRRNS